MAAQSTLGVYLSVPFCRAKCSFCNFASGVGSPEAIERYVGLLCDEIARAGQTADRLRAQLPRTVDSVYFGGGTPSLLTPAQLQRIFDALHTQFAVNHDAEITLEAAPGQIAPDLLEAAMRHGVNRVSLGVQSFIDRESAAVGRFHTGVSCLEEIARIRGAGVPDVGADLIAGLPYQTTASFLDSLEAAAGAGLSHISVYMLEIDDESRLGREVLGGGARLHAPAIASEEAAIAMYETACSWLPQHGFAQYEISNFAQEGFAARHNSKHWKRAPYLGFGLDAHSMLLTPDGAVRFANADELADYSDDGPKEITTIRAREAFEESIFLGLRLCEGIDTATLDHEFVAACAEAVQDLVADGLMVVEDSRWKLTMRGRLLSNEVFGRVLETVTA